MSNLKILYVTTELFPYQEESSMASMVSKMALKMHHEGNDVRIFMPKFGQISDRKFQLHEVIRLSGMNIIINDIDQPLIIKVASLPNERLQVYFIENEDFFKRKNNYFDEKGQSMEDNDERAIFFARGVIETIKKLNWVPDVIHINGWMSCFLPLYVKNYYKNDTYFNDTKFILSIFNEENGEFNNNIEEKLKFDDIYGIKALNSPSFHGFIEECIGMVDVVLKGDEFIEDKFIKIIENSKVNTKDYLNEESIIDVYKN